MQDFGLDFKDIFMQSSQLNWVQSQGQAQINEYCQTKTPQSCSYWTFSESFIAMCGKLMAYLVTKANYIVTPTDAAPQFL